MRAPPRAITRSVLLTLVALVPAGGAVTASPVQAPADDGTGLWGVGLGAWPAEAERRGFAFPPDLEEVRGLGANHVLIPVTLEQESIYASSIGPSATTPTDQELAALIRSAHRARLRVSLMPLIEVQSGERDHWRGVLVPRDEAAWWASYEQTVRHYATLAAREDVALFVLGSELTSLSTDRHQKHWHHVAEVARRHFPGPLAWVSNHDALDHRGALAAVDVAGVSAYFPLADDPDAAPPELAARFQQVLVRLEAYQREVDQPLVLFEVGFPSVDGAAMAPWDYTTGAPIDLEEQRAAYAAVARGLARAPFIEGALFWGWFGPGGAFDRYYTVRDKPAEAEVRRLLIARRGLAVATLTPAPAPSP